MKSTITLRPYQNKLIEDLRGAFASGKKKPLAVAPTGAGKTVLFSYMTKGASEKGLHILILAHREELLFQISETLEMFNCQHGFIMPGNIIDPTQKVQVGSVFTVLNKIGKFKAPDLIIVDEAHHFSTGNSWSKVIASFPTARVVGVTATACRLDGKPLGDLFDELVMGPTVADLIKLGALSDYVAYAPALVNTDNLKTRMGDYIKSDIEEMMNKPSITGDAVKEWQKIARNKRTIVFCVSVLHAKNVAEAFQAAGITAMAVDGKMDKFTRRQILADFKSGKIQVLTNVNIFTEGFDCKTIDCVVLLRPTASLSLYLQMVGRGLRICEGKDKAIILDHVKSIETHGLPDEDREWSLSERIKKRKGKDGKSEAPVKVCLSCFAANSSLNHFCVFCGAAFEIKKREGPEEIDGELKEVDKALFKRQMKVEQGMAKTMEELIALGVKRGMKNPRGWAYHIYNSRKGKR